MAKMTAEDLSLDVSFEQVKPLSMRQSVHSSLDKIYERFHAANVKYIDIGCPFCLGDRSVFAFVATGFHYKRCLGCQSVYHSPRPEENSMDLFYSMSPTISDEELNSSVLSTRLNSIMKPRLEILLSKLAKLEVSTPVNRVLEIGSGVGVFMEALLEAKVGLEYTAVEPAAECHKVLGRLTGVNFMECQVEDLPYSDDALFDLIFINSVIEHPFNPEAFMKAAFKQLKPGGYLCLVDMCSTGFDIELLKENAQNVNPLLILQIASVNGMKELAKRVGFTCVDDFSMGTLDVNIVFDFANSAPDGHPLKGFGTLLSDQSFSQDLQKLLRDHKKTGYMGYVLTKEL